MSTCTTASQTTLEHGADHWRFIPWFTDRGGTAPTTPTDDRFRRQRRWRVRGMGREGAECLGSMLGTAASPTRLRDDIPVFKLRSSSATIGAVVGKHVIEGRDWPGDIDEVRQDEGCKERESHPYCDGQIPFGLPDKE